MKTPYNNPIKTPFTGKDGQTPYEVNSGDNNRYAKSRKKSKFKNRKNT